MLCGNMVTTSIAVWHIATYFFVLVNLISADDTGGPKHGSSTEGRWRSVTTSYLPTNDWLSHACMIPFRVYNLSPLFQAANDCQYKSFISNRAAWELICYLLQ